MESNGRKGHFMDYTQVNSKIGIWAASKPRG